MSAEKVQQTKQPTNLAEIVKAKSVNDVQVGDTVIHDLSRVAMPLQVTAFTLTEIHCGDRMFSRGPAPKSILI